MNKTSFVTTFIARNCMDTEDQPAYRKAGEAYFAEMVNTEAEIKNLSAKKDFWDRIGIAAMAFAIAAIVITIIATLTPYRLLSIYKNSYVQEDSGKVVEIDPYWKDLHVRDSSGKVVGGIEGGLKVALTGNYKTFGVKKCAEIDNGMWISLDGIHGRYYTSFRAILLWIAVIIISCFIIGIPVSKVDLYEEQIKREKGLLISKEKSYVNMADWNAVASEVASYHAPVSYPIFDFSL